MSEQSRESEKKFISIEKDIEHLNYVINELEKECEFVKKHFTKKNNERLDDVKVFLILLTLWHLNPVISHVILRAALRTGVSPWVKEKK